MYTLPSLPCALPTCAIPEFIDIEAISSYFIKALQVLDEDVFTPDAMWRDSFAMTGSLRTFYSAGSIMEAWENTTKDRCPTKFQAVEEAQVLRTPTTSWVNIMFNFENTGLPATTCSGLLSVVPTKDGQWKIWMIRTILEQLIGQPNVDVYQPVNDVPREQGVKGTNVTNGTNGWNGLAATVSGNGANHSVSTNGANGSKRDFACVVVGGGQAGLAAGGRLQALGVPYVILEANTEVGDNWKNRYNSTKLHTIREYGQLPFERTFTDAYPEFLTKDMLAAGYKEWAQRYAINIWCSTSLQSGTWNSETQTWTLKISRHGETSTVNCSYVVYATGGGSHVPVLPTYKNPELFKGITMHSDVYKTAAEWSGKHGIVVGTANTAHDIAEDMLEANMASVTMIQRSPTYVVPVEHYKETQSKTYNAHIPIELADRLSFSGPAAAARLLSMNALHSMAALEPERFDSLERAGFRLIRYGDAVYQIFERLGGHYMDVGASAKISSGRIKIKSDSLPVAWTEDGLVCANGDRLRADVVVFATGFVGNLRLLIAEHFGHEVASQIDDFWGLDEEGELKGAFKPSGHPGFFYHGGTVGQARYFSRFVALQIKARELGTPLPVYDGTRRTQKPI